MWKMYKKCLTHSLHASQKSLAKKKEKRKDLVVQAKFVAFAKLICGIKCRQNSRKSCCHCLQ